MVILSKSVCEVLGSLKRLLPVNGCPCGRFFHMRNFWLDTFEYFLVFPFLLICPESYPVARNRPICTEFLQCPYQTMALLEKLIFANQLDQGDQYKHI